MIYHTSGRSFFSRLRTAALPLVLLSILSGAATAQAQTVIANPVGEAAAGENLIIDAENSQGIRFSIGSELTVTGISATFLQSDGQQIVAVFLRVDGNEFPEIGPINPNHPDIINVSDAVLFSPGVIMDTPTTIDINYSTTLEAGDYILVLAPTAFGQSSALQGYNPVSGSSTVSYTQDVDEYGYYINGTGAWGSANWQADIRIHGSLAVIPEPASCAILIGLALLAFIVVRRPRRRQGLRL